MGGGERRLRFENLLAVSDPFQLSPSSHPLPRGQPQPPALRVAPWGAPADCALYAPARLPGPCSKGRLSSGSLRAWVHGMFSEV